MRWMSLITLAHSVQMQKNTPYYQVHMEHSPGQTTSWVTNQTSVKFKKLKSVKHLLQVQHYEIRHQLKTKKNCKKHKRMEIKQYISNEEVKREIKKLIEANDNENTTEILWDAAKAVLRGKFIAIQLYLKKQENHRIDNLTLHVKQLEKEEEKISTRKEIIKILAEINEKEMIVKINKSKNWFFEKISKIDKPLTRLIKGEKKREREREKNQINKIRNEKGEVTTDNAEIQKIIKGYYQ